jgi:hypothetical protein
LGRNGTVVKRGKIRSKIQNSKYVYQSVKEFDLLNYKYFKYFEFYVSGLINRG